MHPIILAINDQCCHDNSVVTRLSHLNTNLTHYKRSDRTEITV